MPHCHPARSPVLLAALLASVLAVGCSVPASAPPRVNSAPALLHYLALHGYRTAPVPSRDEDALLRTSGRVYRVTEAGVLVVYQYPNSRMAARDAQTVAGRGARATSSALFQREAMLVLYLGDDLVLVRLLARALGEPRY